MIELFLWIFCNSSQYIQDGQDRCICDRFFIVLVSNKGKDDNRLHLLTPPLKKSFFGRRVTKIRRNVEK